jgi:hypothetical protein
MQHPFVQLLRAGRDLVANRLAREEDRTGVGGLHLSLGRRFCFERELAPCYLQLRCWLDWPHFKGQRLGLFRFNLSRAGYQGQPH